MYPSAYYVPNGGSKTTKIQPVQNCQQRGHIYPRAWIYITDSKIQVQTPAKKEYPYVNAGKENAPKIRCGTCNNKNTTLLGANRSVPLAPATLDVALDAVDGAVVLEFLLVADTLDGFGVEGEGTLGDKGSEENDS